MSTRVIPVERQLGITNFDQMLGIVQECHLGAKISNKFANKGQLLRERVKPLILKVATDENGVFVRTWKGMTTLWRAELVNPVHRMEPWLERHFEGGWGADWTLKKLIDQRVSDRKRKRSKKSKLVIYSIIVMISKCNYL